MKIAVLTGGTSLERDISLRSGDAVKSAIDTLGYTSQVFDIAEDSYQTSELMNQTLPFVHCTAAWVRTVVFKGR